MLSMNIGYNNFVNSEHVIAVVSPESSPVKRTIQAAKDSGRCIDATYGRRTRSVLIMTNGSIVLSAIQPATIIDRNTPKEMD